MKRPREDEERIGSLPVLTSAHHSSSRTHERLCAARERKYKKRYIIQTFDTIRCIYTRLYVSRVLSNWRREMNPGEIPLPRDDSSRLRVAGNKCHVIRCIVSNLFRRARIRARPSALVIAHSGFYFRTQRDGTVNHLIISEFSWICRRIQSHCVCVAEGHDRVIVVAKIATLITSPTQHVGFSHRPVSLNNRSTALRKPLRHGSTFIFTIAINIHMQI